MAGEQREITGVSWMDHQWGDVIGQQVGWDWASVQLDDGSDLMAVMVWDPANREPFSGYATLVSPDGTTSTLEQSDMSIISIETWTSPVTGIEYPSGWKIDISSLNLSLELKPVLLDSEFGRQPIHAGGILGRGSASWLEFARGKMLPVEALWSWLVTIPPQLDGPADPALYPRR